MCGIAGIFNYRSQQLIDSGLLERMTNRIAHRGPDGSGMHVDGPIGLGHRRLAIIDVAEGIQPMPNAEESVWIVFNGEIYNYLELREELRSLGYRFRTNSDTEVIIHAYSHFGERCVERLRGMFAFAIWDVRQQQLFVARDRVGKKPLYYADVAGTFLFASEAKAILEHPAVPRRVDLEALDDFLAYQYVPEPATIFESIRKLEPGHYLLHRQGQFTAKRYWDLDFSRKERRSDQEVLDELEQLVSEAVRIRLMSEVPLGAFLSGGVDSSIVVAMMARHSEQPVRTFSIGFTDQAYNELPFARMVAERYGTRHEELICTPDLLSVLPDMVWHFDEPFGDSSALPTYYVAKLTRKHVTVALNGDGGDEGFAGYERYLGSRYVQMYSHLPAPIRRSLVRPVLGLFGEDSGRISLLRRLKWLNDASLQQSRQYGHSMTMFRAEERRDLLGDQVRAALRGRDALDYMFRYYDDPRVADPVDRMLYTDTMTYLPGDLLVKVDRMTMAHSLEGRSPLLDHKVLEFAAALPGAQKLRGTQLKFPLKQLGERLLPHEVLYRPKQGFAVPVGAWFRGELRPWLTELLADPAIVRDGLLRGPAVQRFVREHMSGAASHSHRLWLLANLELWYRMFIKHEQMAGLAS